MLYYPNFCIQDSVHVMAKFKSRLQKTLCIGDTTISSVPLYAAFETPRAALILEAETKLRRGDLHADKMDFHAAERLFSEKVIAALTRASPNTQELNALLF